MATITQTQTENQTSTNDDKANLSPLDLLNRDGFVVLPSTLFPNLNKNLDALRSAGARLTSKARAGQWPYIRTLPKQFPPWPSDPSSGIWGVQHLMHPSNPDNLVFAGSYFDKDLVGLVRELIGCEEEELIMELYNMLVRPDNDFALRWHRDDIPASATSEEELSRLQKPGFHAQWNLALYDDSSLIVVPGSHKRARTEEERNADPYEDDMPGQLIVNLQPGEVVFYNNNILHRGKYDSNKERMTLHGSIGTTLGSNERARNVLQHGVGSWVENVDFQGLGDEGIQKRAEGMRERLVRLGREKGDVGFFSKDE
ncbi:hypothetical protein GQ43DRAFT_389968 [Delitschia confertaspora ATCC 74209]|uniref:Phytanoyl-CoA dioxygenase n=1 Tax=Delitschia confertaspora ATCC 74209 TaxID=1513339 RepID=A0A9P4MRW6_9PLEO|nr:hypothetical protein GQ43DRAFT_389968 [Delitschia confertaspora ATCC 74209]